jgi:hypothetical protein
MQFKEIESTMQDYFDVMYECDMNKFDRVFHPSCSLFTSFNGELTIRPFAQYRAEMLVRTPPKSLGLAREDRVLTLDALSPEIALAKVHVRIHEKRFVDNLNLLKLEGSWRIVAKIYCHVGTVVSD